MELAWQLLAKSMPEKKLKLTQHNSEGHSLLKSSWTPIAFTKNTGSAIAIPQVSVHPLYNTMRSAHAPPAKEHNKEPSSSEEDKGEDMVEAFGVAYATRSSEEGFGQRYRDNVEEEDTTQMQKEATTGEEHEKSQGSEVKEKEQGRHATEESAFPPHDLPLPSGTGGVAS
ncbi:hypothetical protein SUGI_0600100 [Cryptomeria japonica]|uniref:uncharacterized protein LOC131035105 n=1 Tax=Cryptomeria japonica TaxID=3369 RepID=UPI002414D006|nr:uncharacterized protein LOC131035105 [Cryptomeria japonica]GLJ30334.1 hypothetical protein SUGI_0600100 [Cryptomeria japonica]